MCNFLGSVLPQQIFEMVDQCYSSVTAQSFIQQTKDSTPFRHEGGPTIEEKPQSWLPLFCLLPPSLTCANWASQEGGVFVSPEVFTPIHGFSFCSIFVGFSLSLSFSHCHFGLLFGEGGGGLESDFLRSQPQGLQITWAHSRSAQLRHTKV